MRGVPGARFEFEWAPSNGRNAIAPSDVYPGDDFVDVIGLSVYNQSWKVAQTEFAERWQELTTMSYGLRWHSQFAAEHRKLRSYPEWGTGHRSRDGAGGGDDPFFIARMAEIVAAPDILYHSYFDFPDPDYNSLISSGQYPRAAEEFLRRFGARRSR